MFILINFKKIRTILIIMALIICTYLIHLMNLSSETLSVATTDNFKQNITSEIQEIFKLRNQSFLEENKELLGSLYNRNLRYGQYAYEHALKKMTYLKNWSIKQNVNFTEINPDIVVQSAKKVGNNVSLSLLVSTEYKYFYKNSPEKINTFRIGTYHYLDLIPNEGNYIINKEWYTDPFADALCLEDIKEDTTKVETHDKPQDPPKLNERRLNAIDYADKYCGAASLPKYGFKYNPNYRNHNPQGGDCANFASQILYEGGKFTKNQLWNYKNGEGSKAWLNAHAFNNYMIYSGRSSLIVHGDYNKILKLSYKLLPGDYIAYEKKGKVTHISVVTGLDSDGYALVNSHNSDRYRVPWDLGWSNKNIKFWLVHVNY